MIDAMNHPRIRILYAALLILTPAILAAFKYAQDGLNADIILNQTMALQNPTLFYWGQNRILNVIPFLLSIIHLPVLNLFLVLLCSTLSFFCCIYLISFTAIKVAKAPPALLVPLYLANLFLLAILYKPAAWVSFCLWHFEYSLPCALFLLSLYCLANKKLMARYLGYVLIFLAYGINPFILVPVLIFAIIEIFQEKFEKKAILLFILLNLSIFIIWYLISSLYGSFSNYSPSNFISFNQGIEQLILNFLKNYIRLNYLICLLIGITIISLYFLISPPHEYLPARQLLLYIFTSILAILIITCVVSCIRWVAMNGFEGRYLIFCIYLGVFIISILLIWLSRYLIGVSTYYSYASLAMICLLLYFLWPQSFNIERASIYRECNEIITPGDNLYVGDYWKIWSCASRDVNQGYKSLALGYRSTGNRKNIDQELQKRFANQGEITVYCLNSELEICRSQIDELGKSYIIDKASQENASKIKLIIKMGPDSAPPE